MKEQKSPKLNEELRAKTLENNLRWLESFGCEVDRRGDIIYVQHADLREYHAYMIVGTSESTPAKLHLILAKSTRDRPFIYIDEAFHTDAIRLVLSNGGFRPVMVSQIKVSHLKACVDTSNIQMKLARSTDQAQWSELYSEGFAHHKKAAEVDRSRWQKSFEHPQVLHWFFVHQGRNVGVCQTCIASDVVGVYSFSLCPAYRQATTLICAARALRSELLRRGETVIYFERGRKPIPTPLTSSTIFRSLKVIRRFVAYEAGEDPARASRPPD